MTMTEETAKKAEVRTILEGRNLVKRYGRVTALDHADFGYVMELGRIALSDTCARLRDNEDVREFYLGIKEGGIRGKRRWRRRKTWR